MLSWMEKKLRQKKKQVGGTVRKRTVLRRRKKKKSFERMRGKKNLQWRKTQETKGSNAVSPAKLNVGADKKKKSLTTWVRTRRHNRAEKKTKRKRTKLRGVARGGLEVKKTQTLGKEVLKSLGKNEKTAGGPILEGKRERAMRGATKLEENKGKMALRVSRQMGGNRKGNTPGVHS